MSTVVFIIACKSQPAADKNDLQGQCPYTNRQVVQTTMERLIDPGDQASTNNGNPFVMSVADGLVVSGLILSCWAAAYVFRMMARSVFSNDAE
jgi:hypothetical protein